MKFKKYETKDNLIIDILGQIFANVNKRYKNSELDR